MLTDGALAQQLSGKGPEAQGPASSDKKLDSVAATKSIVNLSGPVMQKNFSIASLMSKTTADTNF